MSHTFAGAIARRSWPAQPLSVALCAVLACGWHDTHAQTDTGQLIANGSNVSGTPGFHYITSLPGTDDPTQTGYAFYALNAGSIQSTNASLTTRGNGAHAAMATSSATIMLTGTGAILTQGAGAAGLFARDSGLIQSTFHDIHTIGTGAYGAHATGGRIQLDNSTIFTQGEGSTGLYAQGINAIVEFGQGIIETAGRAAHAVNASSFGQVTLRQASIFTEGAAAMGVFSDNGNVGLFDTTALIRGDDAHGIVAQGSRASVTLDHSHVLTQGANGWGASLDGGATLRMQNGSINSQQAGAFRVSTSTNIALANESRAIGGNGVLLEMSGAGSDRATLNLGGASIVVGDIVNTRGMSRAVDVGLHGGSLWQGSSTVVDTLTIGSASQWNLRTDASVGSLVLNNSLIVMPNRFEASTNLHVADGWSATDGRLSMRTRLNAGGTLANQSTDRLLIDGNATGVTLLQVAARGGGALTDHNRNGRIDANEGISLVQVGGQAHAQAFALERGYVTAGGWVYTLHAFGPGQTDAGQNALPNTALNWDYRLGNAFVCVRDCGPGPVDPVDPIDPTDPGGPGDPTHPTDPGGPPSDPELPPIAPEVRPAVVPQLPSYLVAPTAWLAYGTAMDDGLHQRLGAIRDDPNSSGAEMFARYYGQAQRYASDVSALDFGYDFRQTLNALQIGGGLQWHDNDASFRTGWAIDRGVTQVTPRAADGGSRARYNATGLSTWFTWQGATGLYVDIVAATRRFNGNVGTDRRGEHVAQLHARSRSLSVELGRPFNLAERWEVIPQVQATRHRLGTTSFTDSDGLQVAIRTGDLTTLRAGARLRQRHHARFSPYMELNVVRSVGGRPRVEVDMTTPFTGGRPGTQLRVAAGATAQLGERVALYGEARHETALGRHGLRAWAGNAGVRWHF